MRGAREIDERRRTYAVRRSEAIERNEADEPFSTAYRKTAKPTTAAVHASCEDYRAAASVDLEHDAESLAAGHEVVCRLLALWGAHGVVGRLFKPLDEWRKVATDVRGKRLPCGHYIPEEVPDLLVDELLDFFEGGS